MTTPPLILPLVRGGINEIAALTLEVARSVSFQQSEKSIPLSHSEFISASQKNIIENVKDNLYNTYELRGIIQKYGQQIYTETS